MLKRGSTGCSRVLHPNGEGGLPGRKASLNSGEREMEVCLSDEESRIQGAKGRKEWHFRQKHMTCL